jgi:hypothetical protein
MSVNTTVTLGGNDVPIGIGHATDSDYAPVRPPAHPCVGSGWQPRKAEIIPDPIRARWYALKKSRIPERVFDTLLKDATYATTHKGMSEVSVDAIDDFLEFWTRLREPSEPVVSISPKGYVVVEWFSDPDHVLAVLFAGDKKAVFNLFDGTAEIDGCEDREEFDDMIGMLGARHHSPFKWSDAVA